MGLKKAKNFIFEVVLPRLEAIQSTTVNESEDSGSEGANILRFPAQPGEVHAERLFGAGFRSPLLDDGQGSILIDNEVDHAFFLRICELYRVLELTTRTLPTLIETYSKFRERKQFEEAFRTRFFEGDDEIISRFDPHLAAIMYSIFNHLHELRIYLRFTDALPSTVEQRIQEDLEIMRDSWDMLVEGLHEARAWNFKKI